MDLNNKKATFWVTASLLGSSIEPIIVKFCYQLGYLSSQLIALKLIFGCLIFIPFYKNILAMKFNHVARSMVIALLAIITNYSVFLAVEVRVHLIPLVAANDVVARTKVIRVKNTFIEASPQNVIKLWTEKYLIKNELPSFF
jgi:hypothetical protein